MRHIRAITPFPTPHVWVSRTRSLAHKALSTLKRSVKGPSTLTHAAEHLAGISTAVDTGRVTAHELTGDHSKSRPDVRRTGRFCRRSLRCRAQSTRVESSEDAVARDRTGRSPFERRSTSPRSTAAWTPCWTLSHLVYHFSEPLTQPAKLGRAGSHRTLIGAIGQPSALLSTMMASAEPLEEVST